MIKLFNTILILMFAALLSAADRIAYGSDITDEAQFKKLHELGFNYYIWKMGATPANVGEIREDNGRLSVIPNAKLLEKIRTAARIAARYDIKLLISSGFGSQALNAWKKLGPYTPAVLEGPRSYLSRGKNQAPWPGDKKFWQEFMKLDPLVAAELSKECPAIAGFLFDLEMYAGKINWWYCSSFDDASFAEFRQTRPEAKIPDLPVGKRYDYLAGHGLLNDYYQFLGKYPLANARALGEAVRRVNPDFQLGMYAFSVDYFHPQFARGLSEGAGRPVWVFSEEEYNSGMTPNVFATMRALDREKFSYRYFPGLHVTRLAPSDFEQQAVRLAEACGGYWFFTSASLLMPQDKLPAKDMTYRFQHGYTLADYETAMRQANEAVKALPENPVRSMPSLSPAGAGEILLTPDIFKRTAPGASGIRVLPLGTNTAIIAGKEFDGEKLFDGFNAVPGIVGWSFTRSMDNPVAGVELKLGKVEPVSRVAVSVPRALNRNYRVLDDDFEVEIQLRVRGEWRTVGKYASSELRGKFANINHTFFDINCAIDPPLPAQMIKIIVRAANAKAGMSRRIKVYDAVHILLSEIAVWKKSS